MTIPRIDERRTAGYRRRPETQLAIRNSSGEQYVTRPLATVNGEGRYADRKQPT